MSLWRRARAPITIGRIPSDSAHCCRKLKDNNQTGSGAEKSAQGEFSLEYVLPCFVIPNYPAIEFYLSALVTGRLVVRRYTGLGGGNLVVYCLCNRGICHVLDGGALNVAAGGRVT